LGDDQASGSAAGGEAQGVTNFPDKQLKVLA
jgi:hypothetical protein